MTVHSSKVFLILLFVFFIWAPFSTAQDSEVSFSYNRDLRSYEVYDSKNFMTGDWGGFRGRLNELGINPTATYYATILGNPVGGESKGVKYAGLFNAYLILDLQKLIGMKRTKFIISGSWASGSSLSEQNIGNFFQVSNLFSGRTVSLYQLILESEFIEDKFRIAVGRMGIGDEFATSDIFYSYVSFAFDYNPVSLSINDSAFLSNPTSSWGARMRLKPVKDFQILAGVYNSNPDVARESANGVDFSFQEGVFLIAELGYMPEFNMGSKSLPGSFKFGAFYDTREFDVLTDKSEKEKGNYSLYWIVEQMVYREATDSDQGLTPWATFTISPDESINTFPWFLSGGLVYEGLIPNRNLDTVAFGIAYGSISNDLEGKDYEMAMELTYIIQATPWLQIQPDVQWIVHPGGSSEIPNALVIGMQLGVDI